MTACSSASVVLVRFPFTDLSATKKRPAVVLSSDTFSNCHGDVVLVPLTSVPQSDDALRLLHWREAGLLKATWLKPLIATVSQSLVQQTLGALHEEDCPRVASMLKTVIAQAFWPAEA
jgi:mRNA interferase MazF